LLYVLHNLIYVLQKSTYIEFEYGNRSTQSEIRVCIANNTLK
jgi:hypothetical protein